MDVRSSVPVFTLNRERVPLAFQASHAGSIPVTRSTQKPLHSKVFRALRATFEIVPRLIAVSLAAGSGIRPDWLARADEFITSARDDVRSDGPSPSGEVIEGCSTSNDCCPNGAGKRA
jgi:hypothetical protein